MPVDEPYLVKFWAGVILFFGISVAIAGTLAFVHVRNGGSVLGGIAMGSYVGGFGAWFVFFAGYRLLVGIKRLCRRPAYSHPARGRRTPRPSESHVRRFRVVRLFPLVLPRRSHCNDL